MAYTGVITVENLYNSIANSIPNNRLITLSSRKFLKFHLQN